MASVRLEQLVSAPRAKVWAIWDDYENIDRFHPGLTSSHLVNGSKIPTGIGAKRQCNLSDNKNWIQEEIVQYVPMEKIVIDAYQGTMPLKKAIASFRFQELSAYETNIIFDMEFTPKMGWLGKLLIPMMKIQFRKMMGDVLAASAQFSEQQPTQTN